MAQLTILWTKTAKRQRDYIFNYWRKRNKSNAYAKTLRAAISDKLESVRTHPNLGRKTNFAELRILAMRHYSIIYLRKEQNLIIIGFWDNRQDAEKLINFLKTSQKRS